MYTTFWRRDRPKKMMVCKKLIPFTRLIFRVCILNLGGRFCCFDVEWLAGWVLQSGPTFLGPILNQIQSNYFGKKTRFIFIYWLNLFWAFLGGVKSLPHITCNKWFMNPLVCSTYIGRIQLQINTIHSIEEGSLPAFEINTQQKLDLLTSSCVHKGKPYKNTSITFSIVQFV